MISWVAMDRVVERKRASDAAYRKQVTGRPLRSDTQLLTDGDLLAKLRSFGIDLDRSSLEQLCDQALSAEELTNPWRHPRTFHSKPQQPESDWICVCGAALWRRWLPDQHFSTLLDH